MKKPELLAPAGDLEKLKIAVVYGADAVYFAGEDFSLRAGADNFTLADMKEGVAFAHERGVKCYMTMNVYARNEDVEPLRRYLEKIEDLDIDAFIVADPGVMELIRQARPQAEIHLSTQANATNYVAARFWGERGVKRIVLARELTLNEIRELRARIPAEMEIETFVHGATCISYSGRCLLSNFMVSRDANRGTCAHPCRWKYSLVEERRPGQYYPVEEDDRGTYIMNSNDLCLIEHIPELAEAGIDSFKIEGRMKSVFYAATVVRAYRKAIDAYAADPENYAFDPALLDEVCKVSHREFTTGFYFHAVTGSDQNYLTSDYERSYSFVGMVKGYDPLTGYATVEQRNKMTVGDRIEIFGPDADYFEQELTEMFDEEGNSLQSAPHPQQIVKIKTAQPVKEYYILRKRKE